MVDNDNKGPGLLATYWSLTVTSGLMMGLRLYCKIWRGRGLWWDDYTLLLSWVSLLVSACFSTIMVIRGFGTHIWTIYEDDLVMVNIMALAMSIFSVLAASISKSSFSITLYRLTSDFWLKSTCIFIIVSANIMMNAIWILALAMCLPADSASGTKVPGECWTSPILFKFQLASSFYSAILDFILAILPWIILKDMSLSTRERAGVCLAMSLAAVAGATGIAKTVLVFYLSAIDYTYTRASLVVFAIAEPAVSIMAISIPVLALYRELKSSSQNYFRSKSSSQSNLRRPTICSWATAQGGSQSRRSTLGNLWKYGHHSVLVTAGRRESDDPLGTIQETEAPAPKIVVPPRGVMKTEEITVRHENRFSRSDSVAAMTNASSAYEKSYTNPW